MATVQTFYPGKSARVRKDYVNQELNPVPPSAL